MTTKEIKEICAELELTQKELADKIKIPYGSFRTMLASQKFSQKNIQKINDLLAQHNLNKENMLANSINKLYGTLQDTLKELENFALENEINLK